VVFLVCLIFVATEAKQRKASDLRTIVKDPNFKKQLKDLESVLTIHDKVISNPQNKNKHLGDMSVECALCGIVINELEGFIAENQSDYYIINYLKDDVCSLFSGIMAQMCNNLAYQIPTIINIFDARWKVGQVCVELGYCAVPFTPYPDPQPVPKFVVNLDLPPQQRWTKICSIPQFQQTVQFLVNTVNGLLPDGGYGLEEVGWLLNEFYYPQEYALEIQGCATQLGVSAGWVTLFNIGYEVTDACTSIVAQTNDGKIYHARNMDFWAGMGFTDSLKNITMQVDFQRGGSTLFTATTFAGYVGVLSGMKTGVFSVTIDTRFYPDGLAELFYEVIAAIVERNASLISFLSRNALTNQNDFESALNNLANDEILADVYYIMAGAYPSQGAVISRNRMNASDIWRLAPPGRWYEVETNYDHWEPPPWFDNRITPANNAMNAMGRNNLSLNGMFGVLSVKPVLNIQTTYTILACPAEGSYSTVTRWCPYPCVE